MQPDTTPSVAYSLSSLAADVCSGLRTLSGLIENLKYGCFAVKGMPPALSESVAPRLIGILALC